MKCTHEHLMSEEIPAKDFKCPRCGASEGDFYIEYSHDASGNCNLLAAGDSLRCDVCNYSEDANQFVSRYNKRKSMVRCPCCHGTGYIKKKKK